MTEEQIVQKVCELMGVNYSHYDNHKMTKDYFQHYTLDSTPKIIVYSSKYGPWEFAILEDMSVITPMSHFNNTLIESCEMIIRLEDSLKTTRKKDVSDTLVRVNKEMECIKEAETFLKENKCSKVINYPKKKINWV